MRINKLYLENYRVHEKLEVEFSKGINLLLGANGKGKSSILEAIGYALFDSKPRDAQKDAVSYGKKSGKIIINFTGIDNEEYQLTKTLPRTTTKLIRISDNINIDIKDNLVKELCGVKGDAKDIYDNIIVAKQNEFISVFKEKPSEREKIFNKIFNTYIYQNLYDKNLKEVLARYERMLSEKLLVKNTLNENLPNKEAIIKELEEDQKREQDLISEINKNNHESKSIEKELEELNNLKIDIQKCESEKKLSQEKCNILKEQINENILAISESEKSELICNENKEKYENYQIIYDEIKKLKDEKHTLEELYKKYLMAEKYEIDISNLIKNDENLIQFNTEKIYNITNLLTEKKDELNTVENTIKEQINNKKNYIEKIDILNNNLKIQKEYQDNLEKINNLIINDSILLNEENKKISNLSIQIAELNKKNLFEIKNQTDLATNKKKKLEDSNAILTAKKNEIIDASKQLKNALCPYLKENCRNLDNKNIDEYFNNKIDEINIRIKRNSNEIASITKIIEKQDEISQQIYQLTILKNELNNANNNQIKISLQYENNKLKKENIELTNSNYLKENNIVSLEDTQKQIAFLEAKLLALNIKDLENDKTKILKVIDNYHLETAQLHKLINTLKKKIEENTDKLNRVKKFMADNPTVIESFNSVNNILVSKEKDLFNLEIYKDLYLKNLQIASKKENYITSLEKNQKNLKHYKNKIEIITSEISTLNNKILIYDEEKLKMTKEEISNIIYNLNSELGIYKNKIDTSTKILQDIEIKQKEINDLAIQIKQIEIKVEMTRTFRDNIRDLGREVSKNIILEIENIATSNFMKITGRTEKIHWSNDDNDKYAVYLVNDTSKLKFEQLSGGEQVAVAIAIRSSMSSIFTESKFSIFDEPTNNLDIERRQSLADSIGEILKNLEQSIIVTHDDTFREMAEKVIQL